MVVGNIGCGIIPHPIFLIENPLGAQYTNNKNIDCNIMLQSIFCF